MAEPPAALSIATAFLDAWISRDFDTAGSFLAADFSFDGPIAHYRSAAAFLAGSLPFVQAMRPARQPIAGFGDDQEALLLYDLFRPSGDAVRIADHYTVRGAKIVTETILWDTHGFR